MLAASQTTANEYEMLPQTMLDDIYKDQKKILNDWGITLPNERELFKKECPLWVKVRFFDWIIREGLEA